MYVFQEGCKGPATGMLGPNEETSSRNYENPFIAFFLKKYS